MKQRLPAQIMVIVLVLMAILSIIALSVTLTSISDKEEKTQNSQYQDYYAVGENKLLDFQQLVGRKPLSAIGESNGSIVLTGDTGEDLQGNCSAVEQSDQKETKTCIFENITSTKAEKLKTIITVGDSSSISGYPAQKDKDILLDIESAPTPIKIILSWASSDIAWNFTVDNKSDYSSEKAVYSPSGGTGVFTDPVTSYSGSCFNYSNTTDGSGTTVTINITCANKMYFRLRPIMTGSSVNINLSLEGNSVPLQRTITSTTTTATTTGSGNSDNPVVVLETTYLLVAQPLSLFDYVLRTEADVIKN